MLTVKAATYHYWLLLLLVLNLFLHLYVLVYTRHLRGDLQQYAKHKNLSLLLTFVGIIVVYLGLYFTLHK